METTLIKINECQEIMAKKYPKEDFFIINHRQISFDQINGYLGDHSILEIKTDKNGKEEMFNFFVKSLPSVESQKTFLLEMNGFFKEKQFFTKYQLSLKKYKVNLLDEIIPICYFANEELFVFEDLASNGFVTLPSRKPLAIDCIKTALSSLAKLHASGLILEELSGKPLTEDFEKELQESFYLGTDSTERGLQSCRTGLKALIDLTHSEDMQISKELFTETVLEGVNLQKKFIKPSMKFRNTICHADLWTKNFMFKFEKGRVINCVLVDFQTYRYGPPAQDVMTFIYLVSDRTTRKSFFKELLRFYYEELKHNFKIFGLKDIVTEVEFYQSCDYFKRFALTQTLLHFQVVVLSDEIANELFGNQDNARNVLFDDKYEFFINTCKKDPIFKKINFEIMEELKEFYSEQII